MILLRKQKRYYKPHRLAHSIFQMILLQLHMQSIKYPIHLILRTNSARYIDFYLITLLFIFLEYHEDNYEDNKS